MRKSKWFMGSVLFIMATASVAHAGVMEVIKTVSQGSNLGYGLAGVALLYIFKVIPNKHIKLVVGKFAYGLGCTVTIGLSKWPYTKHLWNKTIEPFCVDLIDNLIGTFTAKFIEGLRSDDNGK